MQAFATRGDLVAAWTARQYSIESREYVDAREAAAAAVYVPHVYRGGHVIRGFGFSTERIGMYVSLERSGNPALV